MTSGGGPQQTVGVEHRYGTARGQVIFLIDLQLYVIAMKDTFGIDSTVCARTKPSDRVVQAALLHHTHVSQMKTGRN